MVCILQPGFTQCNVVSGYNGFLCNTPEEFRLRIIEIRQMTAGEYEILSANSRKSIEMFNHKNYFRVFESIRV